ncbi:hypothetical protein IMSAGC021_00563 [Muribaculaceae bacterium]|nr:hypothetical protein IMSAGC021_00563 [Muribaculaceae bacterium]
MRGIGRVDDPSTRGIDAKMNRCVKVQKVVAYKCVSLSDSEHDERSAAVKSAQGGQREGMGVEVGHAVLRECHQKAVKISQICFLQGREAESGE